MSDGLDALRVALARALAARFMNASKDIGRLLRIRDAGETLSPAEQATVNRVDPFITPFSLRELCKNWPIE